MSELNSEEDAFFDDLIEDENADNESLPNFAFPNLKGIAKLKCYTCFFTPYKLVTLTGDPDLLCEFNTNDENTISTNEYLDQAIISNLSTLEFKWNSECLVKH